MKIADLQSELLSRGITALDLDDTVTALLRDQLQGTMADDQVEIATERWASALFDAGMLAQLSFMRGYYETEEQLSWALAGYLNLPHAA